MKTPILTCAAALAVAAAVSVAAFGGQTGTPPPAAPGIPGPAQQGNPPPPSEDGRTPRYQLVSGHDSVTGQSFPRVYRLDTFTGQTWILRPRPVPGKDTMTALWERLDEAPPPAEDIKNAEIEAGTAPAK